jgi:hypothetical protein
MMFKKQISLFLAFFLLVSNMGWAFNVHYCGNEIASVTLQADVESSDKAIGCCGLKKAASKCCKDKVVHFQKKSDHFTSKAIASELFLFCAQEEYKIVDYQTVVLNKTKPVAHFYCEANAPPFFKLYHQYLFYD